MLLDGCVTHALFSESRSIRHYIVARFQSEFRGLGSVECPSAGWSVYHTAHRVNGVLIADTVNSLPNILFITHRVPYPPNRGDRIRSYHMLRFLAERANVHLACLTEEPVADETHDVLNQLCERVAVEPLSGIGRWIRAGWSLLTGRSATEGLFASRNLTRTIANWTSDTRYEAVLSFCSSTVQFTRTAELTQVPLVVDLVDVDSEKWFNYADQASWPKSTLYRLEARRVRQLETAIARRSKAVALVSEEEADLLRAFCDTDNIYGISNGVDLEYFQPRQSEYEDGGDNSQIFSLVFVGVLDYRANLEGLRWFCNKVWPFLKQRLPHVEFNLVGRRPGEAARQLAEIDGVNLIGEVPDVRPHVANADVVIAPLTIARGIQNKVLEALAMAKPVVATPQAIEGTEAVDGTHLLAAATPEDWVTALSTLAASPADRPHLAANARRLIKTRYHWPARLEPLESLLGLTPPDQPTHATTSSEELSLIA